MKNIFKILIFVFVFVGTFSIISFSGENILNKNSKVCAGGYSCIPNEGNCRDLGLKNLISSLGSSVNYVNFDATNKIKLKENIENLYGFQPVLCINPGIKSVINYIEFNDGIDTSYRPIANEDSTMLLDTEINIGTARFCHPSTEAQSLGGYAGCCQVGHKLVNTKFVSISDAGVRIVQDRISKELNSYVACCPIGYDAYATDAPNSVVNYKNKCVKIADNNEIEESVDALEFQNDLKGLTLARTTADNVNNVIVIGSRTGAPSICPTTSSCALVRPNSSGIGGVSDCVNQLNSEACIEDADRLVESGDYSTAWSCGSCFSSGQAIGQVTSEGSANKGKIAICRANGVVEYVEGVNGSISDTEACLKSEGGFNSENFNLCKSCRENGGTWSGLGCIDSTPTGIVTWIIRIAYGVMGGVALIQFIIAGVYYQTGQEDKVKEARKNIIATITGLAVLTFSILILRIIGINILDILPVGSF